MKAVGIILAGGGSDRMKGLTDIRAVAAMPVAGAYRAVDFALSNMANSRINTVAVITQYSSRSLNEHLNAPSWWGFGRKQGGLYLLNPTITPESTNWFRGTADALIQNLDFIKERHEPYVVIASGDGVYKLDYNKVLEFHIAKRADVTVVCTDGQLRAWTYLCRAEGHLFHSITVRKPMEEQPGVRQLFCERCGETEYEDVEYVKPFRALPFIIGGGILAVCAAAAAVVITVVKKKRKKPEEIPE